MKFNKGDIITYLRRSMEPGHRITGRERVVFQSYREEQGWANVKFLPPATPQIMIADVRNLRP